MKKQFIGELHAGDRVNSRFAVVSKQLAPFSAKSSKGGQEYLKILLQDSSGTMEARLWEDALAYDPLFQIDDIIYVEGLVSQYNGLQLTIKHLEYVPPENIDISEFISSGPVNLSQLKQELSNHIEAIENSQIRELLQRIFSGKLLAAFCICPGGRSIHHAYLGGLLEHSLEVASLALHLCDLYALHPDLMVAGSLLHDIGKTMEYDLNSISFQLTDRGKLHGHLILGRDILLRYTGAINNFPPELEDELSHMLLSHHGQRDWGSPEVPKTLEAFALFHADLLSARMNQAFNTFNSLQSPGKWSSWDRFLERSFYHPQRNSYQTFHEEAAPAEDEIT